MTDPAIIQPALGLIFILGLRHGLDPDHVAVIDDIVFRMVDTRPRLAGWTGTLFAIGHSLSVAVVAVGVSMLAGFLSVPAWIGQVMEWMVILLLLLVGGLNLHALRRRDYVPVGWRAGLVPASLRVSTHPAAVIAIGMIFGLVFDTATQAAAWGAAAATMGGVAAAIEVAAVFAIGMLVSDTLDSQIVARLLHRSQGSGIVRRYRRAVGWLIVALSFGMAGYGLAGMAGYAVEVGDAAFTIIGATAAALVIALLARAGRRRNFAG